jgi:hypothetical protein
MSTYSILFIRPNEGQNFLAGIVRTYKHVQLFRSTLRVSTANVVGGRPLADQDP